MAVLLKHYLFADEFIAAGEEVIAHLLSQNCRRAFGQPEAQALIAYSQHVIARPMRREVLRLRVHGLLDEIANLKQQQQTLLLTGFKLIEHRPDTRLVYRHVPGAGISNTLALISELTEPARFPDGAHLASFLGLTTSKHISGTTVYQAKHITKQGSPNARYAVINMAGFLCRQVPRYRQLYLTIKARKPPRQGHFVALVAVARDFITHVLYDMLVNQRPFFAEVEDYRHYRQQHLVLQVAQPADAR